MISLNKRGTFLIMTENELLVRAQRCRQAAKRSTTAALLQKFIALTI